MNGLPVLVYRPRYINGGFVIAIGCIICIAIGEGHQDVKLCPIRLRVIPILRQTCTSERVSRGLDPSRVISLIMEAILMDIARASLIIDPADILGDVRSRSTLGSRTMVGDFVVSVEGDILATRSLIL